MEAGPVPSTGIAWRLWALAPILLLTLIVGAFLSGGSSLVDLIGSNPPAADVFDIRRVEFQPGEIRIVVRNPQPEELTIASVTVDDAIVMFSLDRARQRCDDSARAQSLCRTTGCRTTRSWSE